MGGSKFVVPFLDDVKVPPLLSSFLPWSQQLSATNVYEPEEGALPGKASHFCEIAVLKYAALHPSTVERI